MKPESAFPWANDEAKQYNWINRGMTLRDYFAAKAMQAIVSHTVTTSAQSIAQRAYIVADAMMDQRAEK